MSYIVTGPHYGPHIPNFTYYAVLNSNEEEVCRTIIGLGKPKISAGDRFSAKGIAENIALALNEFFS